MFRCQQSSCSWPLKSHQIALVTHFWLIHIMCQNKVLLVKTQADRSELPQHWKNYISNNRQKNDKKWGRDVLRVRIYYNKQVFFTEKTERHVLSLFSFGKCVGTLSSFFLQCLVLAWVWHRHWSPVHQVMTAHSKELQASWTQTASWLDGNILLWYYRLINIVWKWGESNVEHKNS